MATDNSSGALRFLYRSVFGRAVLRLLTQRWVSKTVGAFMSSPLSCPMINGFIRKNGIDMSQFEQRRFKSYNDFFTRRLADGARNIDLAPQSLISPCDSRLTVYEINDKSRFFIKGRDYSVSELLCDDDTAQLFSGGQCLVFRLCVDDYHRYCRFDGGSPIKSRKIKGRLHTVQPIALERFNFYHENSREWELAKTDNFGLALYCEVGALMVGRIVNHSVPSFHRGDEKGYFEFGGSTVVLLLQKGKAQIDNEILKNSAENRETRVLLGQRIGRAVTGQSEEK